MAQKEPSVEQLEDRVTVLEQQVAFDRHLIAGLNQQTDAQAARIENLTIALTTARRIGAAVGIVMAAEAMTEDDAFDLITSASKATGRKVRDIANEVVETGALPVQRRSQ